LTSTTHKDYNFDRLCGDFNSVVVVADSAAPTR
jgi:hypothetical protein